MGPSVYAPTYYDFLKLVTEAGCREFSSLEQLEEEQRYQVCRSLRQDAAYEQGARNEHALVQWIKTHPGALSIMSFHAFERSAGLTANPVDGVIPDEDTLTKDGDLLMVGSTTTKGAGYEDYWVLRLDADGWL